MKETSVELHQLAQEARAFLQKLVAAGYAEDQILATIRQMDSWLQVDSEKKVSEAELPAYTREFVERLLRSGFSENKIMDALNHVAILLIKNRGASHEH
ncbi:hypothetical protein ICN10_01515 [Polynucleobacter sp. 86C-FISCH]|uniref:hypothetical protein n=1 Tax=Polynucleobacter sp. 86C-FISCH TaxID=2689101 RepID=UPI001C0D55AF|nr:hypothetical protein [Polynucleobacter sp. 86C-FISCH]MBU3595074.1 hypothetical protein [Polynucleobacter sp. 86C-FISCH]